MSNRLQFASDNYAGICPEALQAMVRTNDGFCRSYGEDSHTQEAADRMRALFETDCEVFFVFNGTAANALALSSVCQSFHSVICHNLAHIETDECGAPEFMSNGAKLLLADGENGKMRPDSVLSWITRRNDIHFPRPQAISVSQLTETGTAYCPEELRAIGKIAGNHGLHVHMDGARFANAVASLGVSPAELTWKVGVDVLCFSGAKNGMAYGEAVVFFDHGLARDFAYRCKQAGQLASKMRYIAAAWNGMLDGDAWLVRARHANAMARRLESGIREHGLAQLMFPVDGNALFLDMDLRMKRGLREKGWHFYDVVAAGGVRLMCSWNTGPDAVDELIDDMLALKG